MKTKLQNEVHNNSNHTFGDVSPRFADAAPDDNERLLDTVGRLLPMVKPAYC